MRKVLLVKQFYAMKNKDKEKYKKGFGFGKYIPNEEKKENFICL